MPAAAVIPALIAYINVVAVKKLVVGSLTHAAGPPLTGCALRRRALSWGRASRALGCVGRDPPRLLKINKSVQSRRLL